MEAHGAHRTQKISHLAELRTEVKDELSSLEMRMGDRMDEKFRSAFALTIGTNVATVIAVAMVIFAALRI